MLDADMTRARRADRRDALAATGFSAALDRIQTDIAASNPCLPMLSKRAGQ